MRSHTPFFAFNRSRRLITLSGALLKFSLDLFFCFNERLWCSSFLRLSDSPKSLTLAWEWINWGRARWRTKWAFSKKEKTHLQPLVDIPTSSSRTNRGRVRPLDQKPEMVCRNCLYRRPNYKQHSFLLTVVINTGLWAPATLYVKKTPNHATCTAQLMIAKSDCWWLPHLWMD